MADRPWTVSVASAFGGNLLTTLETGPAESVADFSRRVVRALRIRVGSVKLLGAAGGLLSKGTIVEAGVRDGDTLLATVQPPPAVLLTGLPRVPKVKYAHLLAAIAKSTSSRFDLLPDHMHMPLIDHDASDQCAGTTEGWLIASFDQAATAAHEKWLTTWKEKHLDRHHLVHSFDVVAVLSGEAASVEADIMDRVQAWRQSVCRLPPGFSMEHPTVNKYWTVHIPHMSDPLVGVISMALCSYLENVAGMLAVPWPHKVVFGDDALEQVGPMYVPICLFTDNSLSPLHGQTTSSAPPDDHYFEVLPAAQGQAHPIFSAATVDPDNVLAELWLKPRSFVSGTLANDMLCLSELSRQQVIENSGHIFVFQLPQGLVNSCEQALAVARSLDGVILSSGRAIGNVFVQEHQSPHNTPSRVLCS